MLAVIRRFCWREVRCETTFLVAAQTHVWLAVFIGVRPSPFLCRCVVRRATLVSQRPKSKVGQDDGTECDQWKNDPFGVRTRVVGRRGAYEHKRCHDFPDDAHAGGGPFARVGLRQAVRFLVPANPIPPGSDCEPSRNQRENTRQFRRQYTQVLANPGLASSALTQPEPLGVLLGWEQPRAPRLV